MPPTDTPTHATGRRRILKWTLLSISGLAVLSACGAALWLTSWKWSDTPAFHESWSASQQAELRHMDAWLMSEGGRDWATQSTTHGNRMLHELILHVYWRKGKVAEATKALLLATAQRIACAPVRAMLHESIRSGRGDVYTERGMSPALLALEQFGNSELAKAMIERGGAPNHGYRIDTRYAYLTTCTTPTLACIGLHRLKKSRPIAGFEREALLKRANYFPATERIAMLEWMLAHGGDLNADEERCTLEAIFSDFLSADGTVLTAWLLRNGFTPDSYNRQRITFSLLSWAPLPLLQELQQEGHIDVRKPKLDENGAPILTALQALCTSYDFDLMQPQKVAWLLELGADVNATAATKEALELAHDGEPHSPLYLAITSTTNTERKQSAGTEVIDLLLRHGARLHDGEALQLTRDNSEVTDLLNKHGIPYEFTP